jgi:hypothetical protein
LVIGEDGERVCVVSQERYVVKTSRVPFQWMLMVDWLSWDRRKADVLIWVRGTRWTALPLVVEEILGCRVGPDKRGMERDTQ